MYRARAGSRTSAIGTYIYIGETLWTSGVGYGIIWKVATSAARRVKSASRKRKEGRVGGRRKGKEG